MQLWFAARSRAVAAAAAATLSCCFVTQCELLHASMDLGEHDVGVFEQPLRATHLGVFFVAVTREDRQVRA